MSYIIENTGASLRFTSDDGFFFLMKNDIKAIKWVRDDMIKIDTGSCFNSIFIYKSQVSSPLAATALELSTILNNWVTEFLKGYPDPGPGE